MAASSIIDAALLSMAGITDAGLTGILTGLTIAQAADKFLSAFQLSIAASGVSRGTITIYVLGGQRVDTDVEQAQKMVAFLRSMKSSGGGLGIPVSFS